MPLLQHSPLCCPVRACRCHTCYEALTPSLSCTAPGDQTEAALQGTVVLEILLRSSGSSRKQLYDLKVHMQLAPEQPDIRFV